MNRFAKLFESWLNSIWNFLTLRTPLPLLILIIASLLFVYFIIGQNLLAVEQNRKLRKNIKTKTLFHKNHWILWFTELPSFLYFVAFGQGGFGVHRPNCGYPELKKCPPNCGYPELKKFPPCLCIISCRPQLLSLASLSLLIWLLIWWFVLLVEVWLKLQTSTWFTLASSWQSLKVQSDIFVGFKLRVTLQN